MTVDTGGSPTSGEGTYKHIIILLAIMPPSAPLPNPVWVSLAMLPYSTKVGGL